MSGLKSRYFHPIT